MFRKVGLGFPACGATLLAASACSSLSSTTTLTNSTRTLMTRPSAAGASQLSGLSSAVLSSDKVVAQQQVRFQHQQAQQQRQMRPGDWECPSCGAHNFASKTECHRCHGPKPPGMENAGGGGGSGRGFGGFGQRGGGGHGGGGQGGQGGGNAPAPRPGDWQCRSCGANNFAKNQSCFKCQGPRAPDQQPPPQQQQQGGYGDGGRGGGGGGRGGGGGGRGGGQPREMRPGDWECFNCGAHNFASKSECHKCQGPRHESQGQPTPRPEKKPREMKPGDWECRACGAINWNSKAQCHRCQGPRHEDQGKPPEKNAPKKFQKGVWPVGGLHGNGRGRGRPDRPESEKPPAMVARPLDWKCEGCGYPFNRKYEKFCFKCELPRPPRAERPWQENDWRCRECSLHNNGSNKVCARCNAPRGEDQGTPTEDAHTFQWKDGDWKCFSCHHHNRRRYNTCQKCGGSRKEFQGKAPEIAPKREGDWECRSCKNLNRRKNQVACLKCHTPIAEDQKWTPPAPRNPDWECRSCQTMNNDSRVTCTKCGNARAADQGLPNGRHIQPGDWFCRACGRLNKNHHEKCYATTCGAPRHEDQPMVLNADGSIPTAEKEGYSGTPPQGSWTCVCGWINRKHAEKCFKCGTPGRGGEVGDWTCPDCFSANFAKSTVCRACQSARP